MRDFVICARSEMTVKSSAAPCCARAPNGDGTLCGMHLPGRDKRMPTHSITHDAVHHRSFGANPDMSVGRRETVPWGVELAGPDVVPIPAQ